MSDDANVAAPTIGPAPGTPEYNAAMIAKASGSSAIVDGVKVDLTGNPAEPVAPAAAPVVAQTADPSPTIGNKPQRPAHVPEKFWNAEKGEVNTDALLKSYGELERARPQQATPPATTSAAPVTDPEGNPPAAEPATLIATQQQPPPTNPATAMQTAREVATQELQRDGKLSDTSYSKFEKLGFDRNAVDTYIAGQRAQVTNYLNALYDAGGGKDAYGKMTAWAATALTAGEIAAFNRAVDSRDEGTVKMAVGGLRARFNAEFGTGGNTIKPNGASNQGGPNAAAFQSRAEMVTAMKDPRYAKGDLAYHAQVQSKVAAALRQGINLDVTVMQSGRMR
jgi:hypothetical protein